ncbi:MAG TPA: hypothetical protein VK308_06835 [Pyrinomonadaceae bacterium]|nr:hypothetical protein [Pyrinomonadaceae bacterium]
MKFLGYLMTAIVFTVIFIGGSTAISAQNMQNTVVKKQVKFARGQNKATLRGTAKYGMSYVFNLGAKAGQTMEIRLAGRNSELSFSVIAPDEETMEGAFGVSDWSGELPQSGNYSVVVVMNDENARAVPFTLVVKIN